jgi:hypothetical protein
MIYLNTFSDVSAPSLPRSALPAWQVAWWARTLSGLTAGWTLRN